jgi:uncharacterized surface protein with fasciclin (FAS1) repeats
MKRTGTIVVAAALFALLSVPVYAGGCGGSAAKSANEAKQAKAVVSEARMDIIETAIGAESFGTLVAAVKAAGLVETLKGEGPFTVFAPTDEAFAALGEGTIAALLADKEKLAGILTYHVAPMALTAKQVLGAKGIETVNGQTAAITEVDGQAMIDQARIIKTDIVASNGIIHVIDRVILPSENVKTGSTSESVKGAYAQDK